MRDPMNPEQPPSGPLYAPETPAGGASGTQRGSGAAPGAQTGSEGFDAPTPVAHATPCGPNVCGVITHEGAVPEPEPGLREQYAEAIRDAACSGDCDTTEEACAQQRIQPVVWHRGRLAEVSGSPEMFADAVLAVPAIRDTQAEVQQLRAQVERVRRLGDIWFREGAPGPTREAGRYVLRTLDPDAKEPQP